MKLSTVYPIKQLAQDFMESPQIKTVDKNAVLIFDYEKESGGYAQTEITFCDVLATKFIRESEMELYMVEAYNEVAIVEDSPWIKEFGDNIAESGYKHFIVFFDEYGVYQFIAKSFEAAQ
ncbi:MAG TPA: hypothetical protein VGL27_02145 [Negativicutes bacterium]|jgi:hypothetical protein